MSKILKRSIILTLTLAMVFTLFPVTYNSNVVNAATLSKETKLKENKTYSYDLNGDGKKENIKYTCKYNNSYNNFIHESDAKVTLYINGKVIYSKKVSDADYIAYSIMDLDTKDKKLELFLDISSEPYGLLYGAFQRYENRKIKILKSISDGKNIFGYAALGRISGISQIKGDGTFSIDTYTPFYFHEMGNYSCYVPFIMKNDKITYKKTDTYNLVKYSKEYDYVANNPITVYSKADKSSKIVTTINKNESLNIKKVKYVGEIQDIAYGYAYIEDKKGNKGWIYMPPQGRDWDNPLMFKEILVAG